MSTTDRARPILSLDPELAAALQAAPWLSKSIHERHIPKFREGQLAARPSDEVLAKGGAIEWSEENIAVPGGEIPLLILRPAGRRALSTGICYFHGGGMLSGDNRTGIEGLLDWVVELDLAVISVGYRLAPEHPHPVPIEDCYAALQWVEERKASLGLAGLPLMIAGASAGGGIAAGVALLVRDRHGPIVSDQILMCPMLDDRERFASSVQLDGEATWDRHSNRTGWRALLGDRAGTDDVPIYAAPGRAQHLSDLPPAYLDVGSIETFRDETVDYAMRLAQAAVPTELHVWGGAFHGFDLIAADSRVAVAARMTRIDYLRRRLAARSGK